jgi:hypothetical protein
MEIFKNMNKIKLYKLWHIDLETKNQFLVPGDFTKLNDLVLEEKYYKLWNYIQEYRIHLVDLNYNSEYVGFCSASLTDKFGQEATNILQHKLNTLDFYDADLTPIVISQKNWINQAKNYHAGIDKYINAYLEMSNIDPKVLNEQIVYCNSFICKSEIYEKAKLIFRENLLKLFEQENYEFDFLDGGYGNVRKLGCLSERLWGATVRSLSNTFSAPVTQIIWRDTIE